MGPQSGGTLTFQQRLRQQISASAAATTTSLFRNQKQLPTERIGNQFQLDENPRQIPVLGRANRRANSSDAAADAKWQRNARRPRRLVDPATSDAKSAPTLLCLSPKRGRSKSSQASPTHLSIVATLLLIQLASLLLLLVCSANADHRHHPHRRHPHHQLDQLDRRQAFRENNSSVEALNDDLTSATASSQRFTNKQRHFQSNNRRSQIKRHLNQSNNNNNKRHRGRLISPSAAILHRKKQLKLSHHVLCEPISQLSDLRLSCPHESQFIIILEAYYSDLYPEIVCPLGNEEAKLQQLTGSQLINIFRQLYSDQLSPITGAARQQPTNSQQDLIRFNPTLNYGSKRPLCLDDLKQSFQAKCSGRQRCRFSRLTDHQFPQCTNLKPGHVFARYLCVDNALLIKYCNADALLASHTSVLNRVKRSDEAAQAEGSQPTDDLPVEADPSELPVQVDTLDFGFVASPGYPNFYASPRNSERDLERQSNCAWTIEAEIGQRVTLKLLDTSLAPHVETRAEPETDYTTSSSLFPLYEPSENLGAATPSSTERSALATGNLVATVSVTAPSASGGQQEQNQQAQNQVRSAGSSNVIFETASQQQASSNATTQPISSTGRIVFKINEQDYELLRTNLASRLQQVVAQCRGYDQLIVRDSPPVQLPAGPPLSTPSNDIDGDGDDEDQLSSNEFDLITKLPITLYKNHLIDFNNQTIYKQLDADDNNLRARSYSTTTSSPADSDNKPTRRLDYQALLDSLNPLDLVWLYQQNVTLCSSGQLDQLSAPKQKNKISFTSTGNTIQVELVSGHMFNPTNRGVLFWYHKHGCPATLKPPLRSRLIVQNETTEVFACFEGFVFNDTHLSTRVRHCNNQDQSWHDDFEDSRSTKLTGGSIPACIYVEDLAAVSKAVAAPSSVLLQNQDQARFERLMANPQQATNEAHLRLLSSAEEVAVEVVGVSTTTTPQSISSLYEIDKLQNGGQTRSSMQGNVNQFDHFQNPPESVGNASAPSSTGSALSAIWYNMLDYMNLSDQSGRNSELRSITTHLPLRDQMLSHGGQEPSYWQRASSLMDRRLLAPAIVVLFLLVLINVFIYVIFLVALPKFVRLLCSAGSRGTHSSSRRFKQVNGGGSSNKLSHYESDYSVTMGMSL